MASKLISTGDYSSASRIISKDDYFTLVQVSIDLPITDVPQTPAPLPGAIKIALDTQIYVAGESSAFLEQISDRMGRLSFQIKINGKKPYTGGEDFRII